MSINGDITMSIKDHGYNPVLAYEQEIHVTVKHSECTRTDDLLQIFVSEARTQFLMRVENEYPCSLHCDV